MITKKDLQEFKKGLVSKDDLLTTKNDLVKSQSALVKEINERFDDTIALVMKIMADGFDKVNGRLDKIEIRLDKVEIRLDGVETKLVDVEERLDGVETGLIDVKRQLKDLNMDTPTRVEFQNHEKRISNLEINTLAA